jgi:DNA helicase-2/ATP-dependent DNA helicase PcrA
VLPPRADGRPPTTAVLVRTRKQLPGIAAALRSRGLPVTVVGLGGLLEVPEVSDVVATLTVLVDPSAGDAMGRLLTGARWRIGPRDLAALESRARALVHSRKPDREDDDTALRPSERGSIVEALDDLGTRRPSRPWPTGGSAGWPRSWRTCAAGWGSRCPTWSTTSPGCWAWRPSWPARPA